MDPEFTKLKGRKLVMNMICPSCRDEYREGFQRCSECNVALVNAEELLERESDLEGQKLVVIQSGPVNIIKELSDSLAGVQIPSTYKPINAEQCRACVPTFELLVPEEAAETAMEHIDASWSARIKQETQIDHDADSSVIDYNQEEITCPACSATFAIQESCPDCGLFIGIPISEEE